VLEVIEDPKRQNHRRGGKYQAPHDARGSGPVRRCKKEEADGQERRDRQLKDMRAGALVLFARLNLAAEHRGHREDEQRQQRSEREDDQSDGADAVELLPHSITAELTVFVPIAT